MTDAEITRLLAERVMGWKVYSGSRRVYFLESPDGTQYTNWDDNAETANSWNPLTRHEQAWMVVVAMGKRGFWCRMDHPFTDWEECTAGFTKSRSAARGGLFEFRAQAAEMPRAICSAAVKAVESLK